MGYFRAPRRKTAAVAEGESVRAALLVGGGEDDEQAVPKGYFAVYVGAEARRFVVPTSYLRQPNGRRSGGAGVMNTMVKATSL
uniref:Auxin-responsive protein n=1 Tax=Oryza punctata TaxID=4537 RepID=A0A0E0JVE9_ORYPU